MSTATIGANHRLQAFGMSLAAGCATGIGASFVLCTSSLDRKLLAYTMSFSAGVMIYVSLVEVISVSNEYFARGQPAATAYALATLSFFAGVLLMSVVDAIVHRMFDAISGESHSHHALETHAPASSSGDEESNLNAGATDEFDDEGGASIRALAHVTEKKRLLMMSAVVSTAIVLHNIPEGMATYVASFHSVSAGAPLAIAIAIHNIPEGLAVAMPLLYATKNRSRAIGLGALSGMSEPFGALLASLVANENSSTNAFGGMFGLTGGMMVYVCVAELLPAAWGEKGVSREGITFAFFAGCAVMAASLVLEKIASATSGGGESS